MSAASSRSSYESIAVENDCSYPRPEHAPLNELAPRDGAQLGIHHRTRTHTQRLKEDGRSRAEDRLRASGTEGVDTPYVWTGAHLASGSRALSAPLGQGWEG